MSLASGGRGEGALARLPRAYLFYIGALLRCNRVPSLPKVYSSRQISSAPLLAEPVYTRVCEGRKVTSTGSRSGQYCSRRRPVLVAMGHQYCFTQRQYWFFFTPPALAPLVVLFSEALTEAEALPSFTVRSEKRGYKERSEAKNETSEPKWTEFVSLP